MAVQAQSYSENIGFPMFGSQDWLINPVPFSEFGVVDDLYFNNQPQLVHQLHQYQSTQQNFPCFINSSNQGANSSSSSSCNNFISSMAFSQSLSAEVEKQRQEIDLFLQFQSERLRFALQEQRRRFLVVLLKNMESKTMNIMRQKEEDLANATKKTMELQNYLRRAEMENESWQRLAKANEAMVIHLNTTLEQAKEKLVLETAGADDAESMCGGSSDGARTREKGKEKDVNEQTERMTCKNCNSQISCVLFLPCKHLCSCKSCEAFLGLCPVCKSVKEGILEVFLV